MFRWRQWTEVGAKTCTTLSSFLASGTFSDVRLTDCPQDSSLIQTSPHCTEADINSSLNSLSSTPWIMCLTTFVYREDQSIADLINQNIGSAHGVGGGNKRPIEGHSRSCRPAQVKVTGGHWEKEDFKDRTRNTCWRWKNGSLCVLLMSFFYSAPAAVTKPQHQNHLTIQHRRTRGTVGPTLLKPAVMRRQKITGEIQQIPEQLWASPVNTNRPSRNGDLWTMWPNAK